MGGGNLAAGIGLLLLAGVVVFFVEYIESEGATIQEQPSGDLDCGVTCSSDFADSFDVGTIDGAPAIVNGIYLFVIGGMIVAGIILFIAGIVGTPLGGG